MSQLRKKKCSKCEKVKPISEYYKDRKAPDGLEYQCKKCKIKYQKELNRKENNKCVDCGKLISNVATRCNPCSHKGKNNSNWNGGKTKKDGYILIYNPEHPNPMACGYVLEHRLILENYLGRYLKSYEIAHHINGKKDDNRLENLMLFKNQKTHTKFHIDSESVDEENILFDGRQLK